MPWKKGNIREFHKHTCKITFLPENILAFWQSGCLYSALDTTASQWLVRDPFHMFVKCLKMRPGKKTPCSHKALLSLVWKSVFCYQTFSPETYRSISAAGPIFLTSYVSSGLHCFPTLQKSTLTLLVICQFMSDLGWPVFPSSLPLSFPPSILCFLPSFSSSPLFLFPPSSLLSLSLFLPSYALGGLPDSGDMKINRRGRRVPVQQRLTIQ